MNVMSELILQSFTMISIVTLMEFFFETFRYFPAMCFGQVSSFFNTLVNSDKNSGLILSFLLFLQPCKASTKDSKCSKLQTVLYCYNDCILLLLTRILVLYSCGLQMDLVNFKN